MNRIVHDVPSGSASLHVVDLLPEGCASRPPLVLLHDGLGSVSRWKTFPEALAARTGCRVVTFDRLGHGKSPDLFSGKANPGYLEAEALKLQSVLDALGISQPVLFGHGDGGCIALLHAALPESRPISGIVSTSAHMTNDGVARKAVAKTVLDFQDGMLEAQLHRHHGNGTRPLFFRWANTWLSGRFRDWDIRKRIVDVTCPVLVLQGKTASFGGGQHAEELCNAVSGPSEIVWIEACGHHLHVEAADAFLVAAVRFLSPLVQTTA